MYKAILKLEIIKILRLVSFYHEMLAANNFLQHFLHVAPAELYYSKLIFDYRHVAPMELGNYSFLAW